MSLTSKLTNNYLNNGSLSVFLNSFENISAPTTAANSSVDRLSCVDNREKLRVFATTIHEMRNLINGILGLTELLSTTDLDSEQLDYVKTLKLNERYLLNLLNELLDYSQLESGKQTLDIQVFDLQDFLQNVLKIAELSEGNKQLNLKLVLGRDLPKKVRGDARRLQQIVINLIGNAIKFTNFGEVIVKVTAVARSVNKNKIHLKFEIKDTGIGIAPQDIKSIFQPFFQVDRSTNIKEKGVGLGLAISQELVNLMNGKMGVESDLGCGSNFWFTVELEQV